MTEQDVVSTMNEGFFANLLSIDEKLHDQDDGENIQVMIRDDKNVPPEEKNHEGRADRSACGQNS